MTDEAAFLATIAANPADRVARLAYADWLDEQNRPDLADLLKLDVALADTPPWQDRYWPLKAASDAVPVGWPDGIARLAEAVPLLVGVPDDWKSRWRAVRAFVNRWWDVSLGDAGQWSEMEFPDAPRLPPSAREWIAFDPELSRQPNGQSAIRDPSGVRRMADIGGVALLTQSEGDTFWIIRDEFLPDDDPPIDLFTGYDESERLYGGRWSDTVAGFALTYLLGYRRRSHEYSVEVRTPAALIDRLSADFPAHGRFDRAYVFEAPAAVVVLSPAWQWGAEDRVLHMLARDQVSFDSTVDLLRTRLTSSRR